MSDWKKITDEKVSKEHRNSVLNAAQELLADNKVANPSRRWLWQGFGVVLTGLAAALVIFRDRDPLGLNGGSTEDLAVAVLDEEMLEEGEMLMDMELLEELEELEEWEET
ncbi:MAG: hypothetical protein ABL958_10270 [Bdellovibrionia bacterium]